IPDAGGLIVRGRDDTPAIGVKLGRIDAAGMPLQGADRFPGLGIPDPCRLIIRGSYDPPTIGAEGGEVDDGLMSLQEVDLLPGCAVPDPRHLACDRDHAPAIRAEAGGPEMALEGHGLFPGRKIPEGRCGARGRDESPAAVRTETDKQISARILPLEQSRLLPPARDAPEARCPVIRGGGDPTTVGAEGHGGDWGPVPP